jgi:steroid delta-isomerase-like uncharacterized protein
MIMTAQEMKQLTRYAFAEVWNKGNLEVLDEIMSPETVFHVAGWGEVRGPEGFREFASMTRSAFPDIQVTIEDQIVEGDRMATRWSWTGSHRGEFMGIPPTTKEVTVSGITMGRVAEDRRGESWLIADLFDLLQQLGALPEQLAAQS